MTTSSASIFRDAVPHAANRHRPIFLWATPRSVSTAFERVMKNSRDLAICHEPFTEAYYFGPERKSRRYGDGTPSVGGTDNSCAATNARLHAMISSTRVFMKDLAFQAEPYVDDALLRSAVNLFITRHPHRVYASLVRLKPDFTEDEFGFTALARIYERVRALTGTRGLVLDGDAFRRDPENTVRDVCDLVDIPFDASLLHWDNGNIRPWAPEEAQSQSKYHATLESSTTILPAASEAAPEIAPVHRESVDRAIEIYEYLTRRG